MNTSYKKSLIPWPRVSEPILTSACLAGLLLLGNPAVALLVGLCLTAVFNVRAVPYAGKASKLLLQTAIVLLGLKLNLATLWQVNAQYSVFVVAYVFGAIALGLLFGRLMGLERVSSILMAAGTGICGGTTIASLAPILKARAEQVGVALAIVFLLNAVALFVFPAIGRFFDLSQAQFGIWAALAIHDTSSVVATAAIYGDEAAQVATIVKLSRTLWLIPVVLIASVWARRQDVKIRVPLFILLFVFASGVSSWVPIPSLVPELAAMFCQACLVIALFLMGTQIDRGTLRQLRGKVLWHALLLWLMTAPLTLLVVMWLVR